jgi:hypothetical protein
MFNNKHTLDGDLFVTLRRHCYLLVAVVHVLSMLLLIKIFHQQHRHAIDFVSIEQQESYGVYNAFDVVVVEL